MLLKSVRMFPLPDEFMCMLINTLNPGMTSSFAILFSAASGDLRVTGRSICARPRPILAGARCQCELCFNGLIQRVLPISRVLKSGNPSSLAVVITIMNAMRETSTRRGEFVTSLRTVGLIRGG